MSKTLVATVGLPRSGKSTLARILSNEMNAPIVNRDALRLALHGERYRAEAEPMVKAISLYMIKALFGAGHPMVVYDETNYSRAARDGIKSPDWKTMFWEVSTPASTCMERAIKTNQADLVEVISQMVKRYEPLGEDELRYPIL